METSIEPPRRFVQATASVLEKKKCLAGSLQGALEVAVHGVDPSRSLARDDSSTTATFDGLMRMGVINLRQPAHLAVNFAQGHHLRQLVFRALRRAIANDPIAPQFQRRQVRLALGQYVQRQKPGRQQLQARLKLHSVYRHRSWPPGPEARCSPPCPIAAIELKVSANQVPTTNWRQCSARPARAGISSRRLLNPCSDDGSNQQTPVVSWNSDAIRAKCGLIDDLSLIGRIMHKELFF